jgi:hypothetical protein
MNQKTTALDSALEARVHAMILDARRRRSYVHSMAMSALTPKQYARALPIFERHGYGVNVFPIHHTHPPLSMAINTANVEAANALLEYGADPNMSYPTNHGRTSALLEIIEGMHKHQRYQPRLYRKLESIFNSMIEYGASMKAMVSPSAGITYEELYARYQLPDRTFTR